MKIFEWLKALIGLILITPPVIGVFLFIIELCNKNEKAAPFQHTFWTGFSNWGYGHNSGVAYSSTLPIFLGLMAIAGTILLSPLGKKTANQ